MTPQQVDRLAESLQLLAAPAEVQVAYLDELGTSGSLDELALEFDDRFRPLARELDDNAPAAAAACRCVEEALNADDLLWTADALTTRSWRKVRSLAEIAHVEVKGFGLTQHGVS